MPKAKRREIRTPEGLSAKSGELLEQLNKESDRGVALIAAAYLDATLESMLRKYLVDDAVVVDELFKHPGALSGFSARIRMAYCLGLIGPDLRHNLDIVRDIRNDFAHDIEHTSFDTDSVRDRCSNLKSDVANSLLSKNAPARYRFALVVTILLNQLLLIALPLAHRDIKLDFAGVIPYQVGEVPIDP
jgi:DNA-binding MltR family transcriptional regulator